MLLSLWSQPLAAMDSMHAGIHPNSARVFTGHEGKPAVFFHEILNIIAEREGRRPEYVNVEGDACLNVPVQRDTDRVPEEACPQERKSSKAALRATAEQQADAALLNAIDPHRSTMKADIPPPSCHALNGEALEEKSPPPWIVWLGEGMAVLLLLLLLHNRLLKRAMQRHALELEKRRADSIESPSLFRTLFETATDAIFISREERLIDANPAMLRMFRFPDMETLKHISRDDIFPPQQPDGRSSREAAAQYIRQAMSSGPISFEWVHRRADGELFPSEVTLVPMAIQGDPVLQTTVRDLSLHKTNEAHLRSLNRAMQALSATNHILIHAQDEDELLNSVCRVIVEVSGYALAWVGFAQHDEDRLIKPVAKYGLDGGYLDNLRVSWRDDEYGRGPGGTAFRSGKPVISHNTAEDPRFAPWREQATRRGYASVIVLPLMQDDKAFGILVIYSDTPDAFDEDEQRLLSEMAADLAFGIHSQRIRREHARLEVRLQNALLQTIQAITIMLEKRDPYTAGHQRRSSDLAVAIANEMDFDPERTEGIRLGSMIHDIGNIYVPSEILNRPGPLSPAESKIVRSHPQVGYDIVKEIDFPWPVATMILQHQERLDGSGYPAGLKGDEIMLEARIIGVVDVVEAMISHRPYRPALALDSALQELIDNRGIKYDTEVVDACLRLFNEKGYALTE